MYNIVLQENKSNNLKRKRGNNISSYFSPSPSKKEYLLEEKTAKSLVSTQRKVPSFSCYELIVDELLVIMSSHLMMQDLISMKLFMYQVKM